LQPLPESEKRGNVEALGEALSGVMQRCLAGINDLPIEETERDRVGSLKVSF
jgi:hypothetical protein